MKADDFLSVSKHKTSVVESKIPLQQAGFLTPRGLKTKKDIPDGSKLYNQDGVEVGTYSSLTPFNIEWINKDAVRDGDVLFVEKSAKMAELRYKFESKFNVLMNEAKLKEAFDLGYNAAYYGDQRTECPYTQGSIKHQEWNRGYSHCNTPGAGLIEDATGGATSAGAVAAAPVSLFKKKKVVKRK